MTPFFQLMRKNPEKRLGSGEKDAEEVKMQRFFKVCLSCFSISAYRSDVTGIPPTE